MFGAVVSCPAQGRGHDLVVFSQKSTFLFTHYSTESDLTTSVAVSFKAQPLFMSGVETWPIFRSQEVTMKEIMTSSWHPGHHASDNVHQDHQTPGATQLVEFFKAAVGLVTKATRLYGQTCSRTVHSTKTRLFRHIIYPLNHLSFYIGITKDIVWLLNDLKFPPKK